MSGNLPTLTAGPFSLEFTFGSKGLCTLWLGPGKYRLAAASLDPEDICAQIREQNGRLFPDSFDEPSFLAELEKAYRLAVIRTGAESGGRVPVTSLIPEIAFMRQKPAFLIDPRKETFRSYGRVEFAADLSSSGTGSSGEWTEASTCDDVPDKECRGSPLGAET